MSITESQQLGKKMLEKCIEDEQILPNSTNLLQLAREILVRKEVKSFVQNLASKSDQQILKEEEERRKRGAKIKLENTGESDLSPIPMGEDSKTATSFPNKENSENLEGNQKGKARNRKEHILQLRVQMFIEFLAELKNAANRPVMTLKFLDTSTNSPLRSRFDGHAKPDISLFHQVTQWSYAVAFGELKHDMVEPNYASAVGQLFDRFANMRRVQTERKECYGFILSGKMFQMFATKNSASFYRGARHEFKNLFSLHSPGLLYLTAFLLSDAKDLGFHTPLVPLSAVEESQSFSVNNIVQLNKSDRSSVFIAQHDTDGKKLILKVHRNPSDLDAEIQNLRLLSQAHISGVPELLGVMDVETVEADRVYVVHRYLS
jgi:hypothetical protein